MNAVKEIKRLYRQLQRVLDHDCFVLSGVTFDEETWKKEAETMDTAEFRARWPRKECPKCRTVCYASYMHYLAGGW